MWLQFDPMLSLLADGIDLLDRPANAIRTALAEGPSGFERGLRGQKHTSALDLPGIASLPDEGPSLGPLHVTPRTAAGFGFDALVDPLNLVGIGAARKPLQEAFQAARRTLAPDAIQAGARQGMDALSNLPQAFEAFIANRRKLAQQGRVS